jgi:hypothetical protein
MAENKKEPHALIEFVKDPIGQTLDKSEGMVRGTVGGLVDATAMNVAQTLKETWTGSRPDQAGALKSAINVVGQPVVQTIEAAKEVGTGHPFRAAGRIVVGAAQSLENGINVVDSTVGTTAAFAKRVSAGLARSVGTVVTLGDDITTKSYAENINLAPPQALGSTMPPGIYGEAANNYHGFMNKNNKKTGTDG